MAQPSSILNTPGGQSLDTLYGPDGTGYIKAAGDSVGAPTGITPPAAPQLTQLVKSGTAARSSLTSTATADSGTSANLVLAANAARKGVVVYNESTAIMYLGFGTAHVSATDYTYQIPAGATLELPFGFSGQLRAIWTSANGFARITELT